MSLNWINATSDDLREKLHTHKHPIKDGMTFSYIQKPTDSDEKGFLILRCEAMSVTVSNVSVANV